MSAVPRPAVRPRDAATLILFRTEGGRPRVLMGQRHSGHVFMPEKFVFPGGRVDPGDSRVKPLRGLRWKVEARLAQGCSPTRARALALASVRETFEETGLRVGRPVERPPRTRSPSWSAFFARGVVPDLAPFDFVARAITPPDRPRRFDARFFMAHADQIQGHIHKRPEGSGELLDLHWVELERARELDLAPITRIVIDEIAKRLSAGPSRSEELPVPFFHFRNRQPAYTELP